MDLTAYLDRIGWSGPVPVTAETLGTLATHHGSAIAFENLNPFLGLPVDLDIAALERKMVRDRRGGYCFEQNALFAAALRQLGFTVTGLGARVLWIQPNGPLGPRSHMVLRVDIAGEPWIVDVGFGGLTLTGALRLVAVVRLFSTTLVRDPTCAAAAAKLSNVRARWRTPLPISTTPNCGSTRSQLPRPPSARASKRTWPRAPTAARISTACGTR